MQQRKLQPHQVATARPLSILGRSFLVVVLLLTGFIPQFSGATLPFVNSNSAELQTVRAASDLVLAEVYGGGQGGTATYKADYVVLFNKGANSINLTGYSVQYFSNAATTANSKVDLSGSIAPNKYFLVKLSTAGTAGADLPTPDNDFTAISASATNAKVALVLGTTLLACTGTSNPTCSNGTLVDLVGYGTNSAPLYEGSAPVGALTQTSAAIRANGGCTDTDNNAADFAVGNPTPRNSATAANLCGPVQPALNTDPSNLTFSALQGGANPPAQTVTVTSVPGPISYTVAVSSSGWLAASSTNGQAPDSLNVTATVGALAPGQYNGVITLTGVLTPTIVKTVPVVFTIFSNTPTLFVTPGNLNFSAITGGSNPASQLLSVSSPVGNPNFTVAVSSTGWLSATPTSGTAPASVTVSATTGSLAAGVYNGVVTFTNTTTVGDVKTVPVTFTINATQTYTPVNQIQKTTGLSGQWKSQLNGQVVTTEGIVTVKVSNGFWIQEPNPDDDLNTSEGIFVFSTNATNLGNATVGHRVRVGGTVTEFIQTSGATACKDTNKPTITEISTVSSVTDLGTATPIAPTIVSYNRTGTNIRQIPTQSIYTTPAPNQETDGIDFWESLEGMYVQVDNALVVGPTDTNGSSYHTLVVLADNGVGATTLNARKGIPISSTDFNPERLQVLLPVAGPFVSSGDKFTVPLIGNIDIDCFTTPTLKLAGTPPTAANIDTTGRPAREVNAALTNPNHLRIVGFNVENLDPGDPQAKFDLLGSQIINNLGAPDILSLQEVQDNNGATDNGVVNSDTTLNKLRDAVLAASGNTITYNYVYIAPVDGTNGGEPGGNIRPVFFYRTDRGLSFVSKPGGNATTANEVLPDGSLKYSPGLIDPTNAAFDGSRKPLAGEFNFKGQKIIVVANHWNSKGGDSGTYAVVQPPVLGSEAKRVQQATAVRTFVNSIQAANPNAYVLLNGDFNDFEFSPPIMTVKTGPTAAGNLLDGNETIPLSEDRYTYRYEGNAQSLDHTLYTLALSSRVLSVNATHINADYATNDPLRSSDHDPVVVNFDFTPGCVGLTVTLSTDNGQADTCGSFSYALLNTAANGTITFALTQGNTITFTGALTPTVKTGVTINGGANGIQLVGNGVAGDGLVLSGNNTLQDLTVRGFTRHQLVASSGGNKIFRSKFYD